MFIYFQSSSDKSIIQHFLLLLTNNASNLFLIISSQTKSRFNHLFLPLKNKEDFIFVCQQSNYIAVIIATMSKASLIQKVMDSTAKPIQEPQSASTNEKSNKNKAKQSQTVDKVKENITADKERSKFVTELDMKDRGKSPSMKEKHELLRNGHKAAEIANSLSASRLQQIQNEKQTIQNELKQLDKQISEIRQQQRSKSILHKREEISNNRQARKMAISLIRNHRARKKEFQEKKKAHNERTLSYLKQQFEQTNKKREQFDKIAREEKRRVISMRMNEGKKQVEERREFQKLSNQLINRLLKEQDMLKQKTVQSPIQESQPVVRVIERIPPIDFTEIEKHEQAYLQQKQQHAKKKEGTISVSYPIKKFEKSRWAEKLQEVQQKQKQEQKIKQLEKKLRTEKRLRYGEMIHSLFVKKNKVRTENSLEKVNVNSQSILVTPSKELKGRQSTKKARDSFVNTNPNTAIRQQKNQLSPQQVQKKDSRQRQLRKQTVERLRKIQSSDIKRMPQQQSKYQSKYQNYLGQVKIKKRDESEIWNSILNNKEMSKEQKYTSMLKKAIALENKAKFKQSLNKESHDEVVDLYLDSIQAKLTLLEKI